ncbi:uncharacterized protein [Littorina saxatilis]|uniref:Uncharacterized protein n=1 Tax=Littorina saxatilis TaxID=31220 RepID=A0AAN9BLA8_9CAEN
MYHLCYFALAALTFDLGWSQERVRTSWLPEEIPNPQKNPKACGLGPNPGYICDPNGILTRHQLETIDWFLNGIAFTDNQAMCPCSRYHCEHGGAPRFYKVAIALVPRLALPMLTTGRRAEPLDQVQNFAYRLEHDLWNISSCEEDIVIVYSRDDQALVTMTGSTAGRRLDPYSRSVIHSIVGQHFADNRINEGLLRMVYEIELVLNGNNYYRGMVQAQVGGTGHRFAPSSLSFVLIAVSSVLLSWFARSS